MQKLRLRPDVGTKEQVNRALLHLYKAAFPQMRERAQNKGRLLPLLKVAASCATGSLSNLPLNSGGVEKTWDGFTEFSESVSTNFRGVWNTLNINKDGRMAEKPQIYYLKLRKNPLWFNTCEKNSNPCFWNRLKKFCSYLYSYLECFSYFSKFYTVY